MNQAQIMDCSAFAGKSGQPVFCVTRAIDSGLQKTLEADIVPRLLTDIPGQPAAAALAADPRVHRFTLIFDRKGYSPDLFLRLREQRIAILTYHRHPGPDWPESEFTPRTLTHPHGGTSIVRLAGRGHQCAILSTDYRSDLARAAASMFARWNQENFFKYMRQHFGLDRLVEYGISPLPDTTRLVDPTWRALESQARRLTGELTRQRAAFAAHTLRPEQSEPAAAARHEKKQVAALGALTAKEAELTVIKDQRKATPRHIELKDLPAEQRVAQLRSGRKHFINTIKLIAYRAGTVLVQLARETLLRTDDARSLVRGLINTGIDLRPDIARGQLRIELHGQANPVHDGVDNALCKELNETETHYPDTALCLKYVRLRSAAFPAGQDI